MSKRNRLKKQVAETAAVHVEVVGLKVGSHQFPAFDGLAATFGARRSDYPTQATIPAEFYNGNTRFNNAFSALFFRGGTLADHGLRVKAGLDRAQVMAAVKVLMCSFDPKHEIKEATVAWALSEWCDVIGGAA
jgi:hypothetical protein